MYWTSSGEVNESTTGDEGGDRGGRGRGAGGRCLLSEVKEGLGRLGMRFGVEWVA